MVIRVWKVGELAERAGLTVRTLHHWDRIGLLSPSNRTGSGHRLYDEADVRRLYEVVALRDLGLSLDSIANLLAARGAGAAPGAPDAGGGWRSLADVLTRHLAHVDAQIAAQQQLRDRLASLVGGLRNTAPPTSDLLDLIDEVTRLNDKISEYYTEEQLATLRARRERLGEDTIAAVEAEWPELIAKVQAEMNAGTDPADPRVRPLAVRWMELLEQFDGGDPEIREANHQILVDNPEQAEQGYGPPQEMIDYITRVNRSS